MRDSTAIRVKGGVLLLCVSALFYSVEICRRTHILTKVPPDSDTLNEIRLAPVKKQLPSQGVIGYVSDDSRIEESVAWRRYAMTQYALAPLIVERTTEHKLIVGVFKDPDTIPTVAASKNLRVTQIFDEGVVLFQKE